MTGSAFFFIYALAKFIGYLANRSIDPKTRRIMLWLWGNAVVIGPIAVYYISAWLKGQ